MRRFPKNFNTKEDIYNSLDMFPEKTKAILQNAVDNYEGWVAIAQYDEESECIQDDTHDYLIQENEGVTVYIQREFMPIPGNMIDRLGFTLNEVQGLIDTIKS